VVQLLAAKTAELALDLTNRLEAASTHRKP